MQSGSTTSGRFWAASEPDACAARNRIRAIEFCVSRLFSFVPLTTKDDAASNCRIESGRAAR